MRDVTGGTGPHAGQPIARAGAPPGEAAAALILVHGRGGDAEEMLGLAGLVAPPALACLAPQLAARRVSRMPGPAQQRGTGAPAARP